MFLDLEMTFLAALSLVLANNIIPNITESSFINVAKVVLQDMSRKGNIAAALLKSELDDICTLLSSLSPSIRRSDHQPSLIRKPIAMVHDGQYLNDAILDVIGIQPATMESSCDPSLARASGSDFSPADQRQQPDTQKDLTVRQAPSWQPAILPTSNSTPHSNEMNIDYIDAAENPFTFDMADLHWLDSVQ